jgi:hypothetical protein
MKIAILTANLGNFDTPVDPVTQNLPPGVTEIKFHRFTDKNFPPITGLTPRFQYRIPKLFGWQMFPGYDYYLWLDGAVSPQQPDSLTWFFDKCRHHDIVLFKHPWRSTIKEETDFIAQKIIEKNRYIIPRYLNGLHQEQLQECLNTKDFKDNILYTSTAFMYRNTKKVQAALKSWWYYQSRYFTCDQIVLPYVVFKHKLKVNLINENQYKIKQLTLVSRHK